MYGEVIIIPIYFPNSYYLSHPQDLYEYSKIYLETDGTPGWIGNGGTIVRGNVEKVVFTYTVVSDEKKKLIIFSTGNYKLEPTDDDCQLRVTAEATVGAYRETKTYTITFRLPQQKSLFHAVLMADDVALNGRGTDATANTSIAAGSSSRRVAGIDDDEDEAAGCDASLQEIALQSIQNGEP